MKKRTDLRAAAAYRDVHGGLSMALAAARELLCKDHKDDVAVLDAPSIVALEKVAIRVAKACKRRVPVQFDNDVPTDIYVGKPE